MIEPSKRKGGVLYEHITNDRFEEILRHRTEHYKSIGWRDPYPLRKVNLLPLLVLPAAVSLLC